MTLTKPEGSLDDAALCHLRRNSERPHFCLITGFRYIHPPDRGRPVRADAGVHARRHLGPGLAGHATSPSIPAVLRPVLRCVTCRTLTSVFSSSAARASAGPGQRPVTRLHRLENPPAQPPYLLLMEPPVHTIPGATIERGQALRSVHRSVNVPVSSGIYARFVSKAHLPTSAPLRARASSSLSGQLYGHRPGGDPALRHPPSCCLPAAGIRFLGTLSRPGLPPLLRSAYRPACTYPCLPGGPWRGFHVPHA